MQRHPLAHNPIRRQNPFTQAIKIRRVDIRTPRANKRMDDARRNHIIFRLCHQDVISAIVEPIIEQRIVKHIPVDMREMLLRRSDYAARQFHSVNAHPVLRDGMRSEPHPKPNDERAFRTRMQQQRQMRNHPMRRRIPSRRIGGLVSIHIEPINTLVVLQRGDSCVYFFVVINEGIAGALRFENRALQEERLVYRE